MQRKVMWGLIIILGGVADFALPLWLGLLATLPIIVFSWWVAYRSGWIV